MRGKRRWLAVTGVCAVVGACATLGELIQPPRFDQVTGRSSELRLLGPSASRPLGGAGIRLWARVENPNAFGLTLSRLAGNLLLEGEQAATVDLPLGLPMVAQGDTIIPLDVSISFADLPGLANALRNAVSGNAVGYRLVGNVAVDAGPFGQPTFGPSTLLSGDLRVVR